VDALSTTSGACGRLGTRLVAFFAPARGPGALRFAAIPLLPHLALRYTLRQRAASRAFTVPTTSDMSSSAPRGTDPPENLSSLGLARVTTGFFHAVAPLAWEGKGGDIGQPGNCT
jgi:hypothetical protein